MANNNTAAPKTEAEKEAARKAKIALTPRFVELFSKEPTNFQNAEKMQQMITEKEGSIPGKNIIDPVTNSGPTINPERSGISIVIPYLHAAAAGEELKYALRAWAENFPDSHIIIIGDKPDFISDEVVHIPSALKHTQPQLDVAVKIMQALADDRVTGDFIFTNDDIYPVNPLELADITSLKCAGKLGFTKKKAGNSYIQTVSRTKGLLEHAKYPTWDYSTHTPFFFNKEKMAKVFSKYQPAVKPALISSLYYNSVFKKEQPELIKGNAEGDTVAYVYRENPNLEILEKAFQERKFINHNNAGYASVLPFLENFFPEKCKYEL